MGFLFRQDQLNFRRRFSSVAFGVHVERVRKLRKRGDFTLQRLERTVDTAKSLASTSDVRADKASDAQRLTQIALPSSLQELNEAVNVAAVYVPRANASDETLVHRAFLFANGPDAAEERFRLRVP